MYFIKAIFTQSGFWNRDLIENIFDDIIGYAVLCVACVLYLSFLREKPPEFEKKQIAGSLSVIFVGGSFSRILAHYSTLVLKQPAVFKSILIPANLPHPHHPIDELLEELKALNDPLAHENFLKTAAYNLLVHGIHVSDTEYQRYIVIVNIITTVVSLISITIGAFILMKIFDARHAVTMTILQIFGFLTMKIMRILYTVVFTWTSRSVFHKAITEPKFCGFNGFAYGCFMIIIIILYIIATKRRYESFWTKNSKEGLHILSLLGLIVVYTLLNVVYNYLSLYFNMAFYLYDFSHGKGVMLIFEIMIFVFLAVVLLYVPKVTYSITRKELQEEFFEVKRKEEVERYSYSEAQIKAERKYMHDLPGHFRAIASMANRNGADEIVQYVQELDKKLIQSKGEFSTGNTFLDDFLYSKKKLAQQNNIDIVFNGAFPNEGIKKIDITTIFHNLIENAIEACKTVPGKREIIISSKIHEDRVYISFSNPFEQKIKKKQGKFETSKKNKAFHGYGLSSVESVVTKKEYDGSFSKRQEGNTFIAEVNLRYQH